jgi:sarcosine oxidase
VNEPVQSWRADNDGVSVTTGHATYRGSQLIVAAGAWAGELLAEITPPLAVERQVLLWFEPAQGGAAFSAASCPVHLWQFDDGQFMYGFPDLGDGVKIARHHGGRITTADTVERGVAASEVDDMRGLLRQYVPGADGPLRATAVCLYTNTPDQHFWIDRHPAHANVLIASPCSGHGFKFAGVIGEALADLATGASPAVDLSLFRSRWPAGRSLRADGQEKPGRS